MEEIRSSISTFHNTEHLDNATSTYEGSNGSSEEKFNTWDVVYLVAYAVIIIFGSNGNILTFIVMLRGSMKDVSTYFYMSILTIADTGG